MSALDNFSPSAAAAVKMFAYSFHAAPTADIVADFAAIIKAGGTVGQQLDFLFNLHVPLSPFTAYAGTSSNAAFCAAWVDNLCYGTAISSATRAAWASEIAPVAAAYASRGEFVAAVSTVIDNYAGTDADLKTLQAALKARAEAAAVFAQSPSGAVYNGQGWAQLLAPLAPPADPTYALSANFSAVDEGSTVTFTLLTTHVTAGTTIAYTLSGVSAADVAGGLLSGVLTVNADGLATANVVLINDLTTEGTETLRLQLAGNLAHADVVVRDTSVTPVVPTFALSSNVPSQNEGASIVYTLTTTNLNPGTVVSFALSGNGITAGDIVGGALSGSFTIDAAGVGTATVGLVADALTEGLETLHLQLSGNVGSIDIPINDTSIAPPPVGAPDILVIADDMGNTNAHAPSSALEGEIPLNTYLTYDFLNQGGIDDRRMSVGALKATNPVAGAPLDLSNQSADRGNIPQVSNQNLFTFDLGLQTDRVDYSAETGRIVAVITTEAAANTLFVLVNDNAVDNNFSNATDRIDTLKNVEEVVASRGGGVLDLTNSGQDWQINFSRNFNAGTDINPVSDLATHRIELSDPASGTPYGRSFIEFYDGGTNAGVTQPTAAWTTVQGSDRNESLSFTQFQSMDQRSNVLRGGTNAVKFNDLTRSILVEVSIQPWVPSTNLADDSNSSGQITTTTTFTNGDGATPLSGNTNVTSSYTPDNNVAAGMLKIVGTQDAEDAISFSSTPLPKYFVLGQTIGGVDAASVHLVSAPTSATALELSGFEILRDNGATDDVYAIDNIFKATLTGPKLIDGAGADHDAIRLATEALGSAAVGGAVGAVNLATLNGPTPGFNVDFDVLDLSGVSATGLLAAGTAGTDDELVVGALGTLSATSLFESLVLTNASTDKGLALTLDLDAGVVKAGATTLFSYGGSVLSAGGLVFGSAGQPGHVAPMSAGMNITVVDTTVGAGATVWGGAAADLITGGAGNDVLRGGGGNDTLNGGVPPGSGTFTETWDFTIAGTPDGVTAAANRISIAMTIDGTALTLSEAAVADTSYGDGNGAVVDGSSSTVIGTAMAGLINANLASINAGPGTGILTGATFDSSTGVVRLSFMPGVNANDAVTFVLSSGAGPDGGTFTLSAGTNINGGNGGNDTFVFEKTAALNGSDTIQNFTPASDKLDVTAFTGAPIAASATLNGAVGGTFVGIPTTVQLIYNKALGALSIGDFATSPTAGKFVLADGARCVVAVTADPTGARGDANNTAVTLYYVENGAAAGLSDLTVSLVGTITGPVELTLGDIFAALG